MTQPVGSRGEVFLDARGSGRALRLTWHHDAGLVVLSLWRGEQCAGTFRLDSADVADFIDALVDGMRPHPPLRPDLGPDNGVDGSAYTQRAAS
jgi:hypothetical protein